MSGITNPSEKYFKDGLWTFDGTVWRAQSQMFGVRASYHELKNNLSAALGTNDLNCATVPAGEIWVVTSTVMYNASTAASSLSFMAGPSGSESEIDYTAYVTPTRYLFKSLWLVLMPGDRVKGRFYGCVLNDYIAMNVHGFKFKIAE